MGSKEEGILELIDIILDTKTHTAFPSAYQEHLTQAQGPKSCTLWPDRNRLSVCESLSMGYHFYLIHPPLSCTVVHFSNAYNKDFLCLENRGKRTTRRRGRRLSPNDVRLWIPCLIFCVSHFSSTGQLESMSGSPPLPSVLLGVLLYFWAMLTHGITEFTEHRLPR